MKIRIIGHRGQVCIVVLLVVLFFGACSGRREETPISPPLTSPLTQAQIGFGVVNTTYTRINSEPDENSVSSGYFRRGSVVRIIERRHIRNGGSNESWVLVEGTFTGWLREALVDIYDNESQARTAVESMRN